MKDWRSVSVDNTSSDSILDSADDSVEIPLPPLPPPSPIIRPPVPDDDFFNDYVYQDLNGDDNEELSDVPAQSPPNAYGFEPRPATLYGMCHVEYSLATNVYDYV